MAGNHADQDPAHATAVDLDVEQDLDWVPQPRPRPRRRHKRALWAAVAVALVVVLAAAGLTVARHSQRQRPAAAPPGIAAGLQWSRVAGNLPVAPTAVIAAGPGFVAASQASGAPLWASPDGANWTQVPVTDQRLASFRPRALALSGDRIYAAGEQNDGSEDDPRVRFGVWSSADGQTWSQSVTPPVTLASAWGRVVVTGLTGALRGKGLVAVGYLTDGNQSQPLAWYTADGRTWHPAQLPADKPKPKPNVSHRLDGVIVIPGGFLAIEGALKTSDSPRGSAALAAALAQEGPPGLLVSSDGQSWRPTPMPSAPLAGSQRTLVPGLLKLDAGRVLAVGVDPEAREVVDRSQGEPRRVVVDRARPIVWRLRLPQGWYRLSQPLPQAQGELGPARPAQASVRAVAHAGGTLIAVGDVTHGAPGDPSDAAVWTSSDGGVTWSDAVSGARFTGAGSGSLTALAVAGDGSVVVAIGTDSGGTASLWRAVPAGSG
jgi:hypothetical protein